MEHSIDKYLERQDTEKLKIALLGLRKQKITTENLRLIGLIVRILKERGIEI